MASSSPLSPTYYGHIASTQDALVLFESCLSGALNHVARRPHDRERASLIKSGNVFIYEEHSSGIKRWTDGVPWSPSRILGNFLVYRELERPFPPGEKKRATKRSKRSPGISKAQDQYGRSSIGYVPVSVASSISFDSSNPNSLSKETERSLIGSLVDSYGFKEAGLVKKTVSVTVGGVSHHLVSYYTVADIMNNKFGTPTKDLRFQHVTPRPDLVTKQNFRTPLDEIDSMERMDDRSVYGTYSYSRGGYEMTNQSITHRSMSLPTPISYVANPSIYSNYGSVPNTGTYSDYLPPGPSNNGYTGQFSPAPATYTAPKAENYALGTYRQPRYDPAVSLVSDASRAQMPPFAAGFSRRASNYENSSIHMGASGITHAGGDSKLTSNSATSTTQVFYAPSRENIHTPNIYGPQRSLPTPNQHAVYERPPAHQPYAPLAESTNMGESTWPTGNASAGHAHYVIPQQPWTNSGASSSNQSIKFN